MMGKRLSDAKQHYHQCQLSQSDCHYRQVDEAFRCRNSDYLLQPECTAAYVGDAAISCRTVDNFDGIESHSICDRVRSCPVKQAHCAANCKPIVMDSAVQCDGELRSELDSTVHCRCNDMKSVPAHYFNMYGSPESHDCDKLDSVSVTELRMMKPAGNVTSEGIFSVNCTSHSLLGDATCLAEESTAECFDAHTTHRASAVSRRHYFQPLDQQYMQKNDGKLYANSERHQSHACSSQPASMNDLDDIDLPRCNASTVNTVSAETVDDATNSCLSHDTGCFFADYALSDLHKTQRCKDVINEPEFIFQAAAETKGKRSELHVQNCVEDDASTMLPSSCPKPSVSNRKSRKKVEQAIDEKSPKSAVPKNTVCDNRHNLAAFDGAIGNNLFTSESDHASRTTRVNAKSDTDCRAAQSRNGKNTVHKENSRYVSDIGAECSEACSTRSVDTDRLGRVTTSHDRSEISSSLRHQRRLTNKPSRGSGPKQKSTKHSDFEQHQTPSGFQLKQFLESINWRQQQQNFGLFIYKSLAVK